MKKKKGFDKHKKLVGGGLILVILIVVLLIIFSGGSNKQTSSSESKSLTQISGLDLIQNKEAYSGKEVKLVNVLVLDPLFAYVEFPDGGGERLFIMPQKSEFCLHFNLTGTLMPDEGKDWIFNVSKFDCVSKT